MCMVRGGTSADYDKLIELMHVTWPGEPTTQYLNDPYFDWGQFRLVEVDGEFVSMIKIYRREIYWGSSTAVMGGIGDVSTHPGHRGRGYGGMLLEDSIPYMREDGYELSMLFTGIHGYYAKYGWQQFPQPEFHLDLSRYTPSDVPYTYAIRRFRMESDLSQIMPIYGQCSSGRTGMLARSPEYWEQHFTWVREDPDSFLVAECGGEIDAYVRCVKGQDSFHVAEFCSLQDHERSATELLAEALRLGYTSGGIRVTAFLPPDNPMLAAASGLGIGIQRTDMNSMMLRLIDPDSLRWKLGADVPDEGILNRTSDLYFWRADAF
jgi:predicted acetyltransferase